MNGLSIRQRDCLKQIMAEHHISEEDFFSSYRDKHLVTARRAAARRLSDLGYSRTHIGRILRRDHSTIQTYLDAEMRDRKSKRASERYMPDYLDDHCRAVVAQLAQAEGVKPTVIVSRMVADRIRDMAGAIQ